MTTRFDVPPHTLEKQRRASDPAISVWVSANAGSGKTHVLTQRVVRLLLRGVAPSKILCLTFTKAAAANMAARVFDLLALWTRLDDEGLRASILATGAPAPTDTDLLAARKLFARTVETPGGLKIQTIHAFCEKLLHLFPFEANVPSRFEVADDLGEAELLARARRDVLAEATEDGELGAALIVVTEEVGAGDLESLVREALDHRAYFRMLGDDDPAAALRKTLGLAEGRSEEHVLREMIEGGLSPERIGEIAAFLETGKKTDKDRAVLLRRALAAFRTRAGGGDGLAAWLAFFFTSAGKGTPTRDLMTKGLREARPDIVADLEAEQARLDGLREERKAAAAFERTLALVALVRAILRRYESLKASRGVLDFDDLIERTLALLERSEASWVLYKLDRGIDHVLVDEAQDTSEAQWRVLQLLTGEFAESAARTFFAVGDEKQSIFSFQGAAPHMFAAMRRDFERRISRGGSSFAHVSLTQSFRSVPGVLAAVDRVFAPLDHQKGLVAEDLWMDHEALKAELPGLVEIWPPIGAEKVEAQSDWRLPLDYLDERDPPALVADRVAAKIAELLAEGSQDRVYDNATLGPRRIRAGDVMVLVRTRGPFFEAMIRALKARKVPVSGADRLVLATHIAVMDLVAAGRAALMPQDDLTLACVLKSPLVGLDDSDLLEIAPRRPASLYDALAGSADPRHKEAAARIARWQGLVAEGPFAFYARLLGEDGGRRALESRLGPEACDAIDEFLRLALAEDDESVPSLAGFLDRVSAMDRSIRRDMETGADVVRVMTVHAAKGLEAKVVFLPDTCGVPSASHDPRIFDFAGTTAAEATILWSPRKEADTSVIAAARQRAREAAEEEYRRLLYVALTRAEERLYIAGFYGEKQPGGLAWSAMVEATLVEAEGFTKVPAFWNPDETILRWLSPQLLHPEALEPERIIAEAGQRAAPPWLSRRAGPEPAAPPPLRPASALEEADRRPWGEAAAAQARALRLGSLTHVLLQNLPAVALDARLAAATAFLSARAGDLEEATRREIAENVLDLIDRPELSALFAPDARAEIAVAGRVRLPSGMSVEVSGRVDRIAETESAVLVADFKTGAPREASETPAAYLAQMALYRALLAPLWPQKPLRLLLIWTAGPAVVRLDDSLLDEALSEVTPVGAIRRDEGEPGCDNKSAARS